MWLNDVTIAAFEDEFTKIANLRKEAILGPLADASNLGMPSGVGYVLGRQEGREMAEAGVPMDKRNLAAALLVPGALGFRYGKTTGYELSKRSKKKA